MTGCGIGVIGCGIRVISCGIRETGCSTKVTDCGIRVTGCSTKVTDCDMRATDCGGRERFNQNLLQPSILSDQNKVMESHKCHLNYVTNNFVVVVKLHKVAGTL